MTLLTATATVHGNNLMDTPNRTPSGLLGWLDVVTAAPGSVLRQVSPRRWRAGPFVDYAERPEVDEHVLDAPGRWRRLDAPGQPVEVTGTLVGGCVETLANLAGTSWLDVPRFAAEHGPAGTVVYVEAAGDDAPTICRNLHGMRLAGVFTGAVAVLVGRTSAPAGSGMTQDDAVLDALGGLGVPLIADVECGHVPPYAVLVNGAVATVRHHPRADEILQRRP
ncbi:MAG: hypothetical protein ACRCZP_09080 [Phycicoccus sp.]